MLEATPSLALRFLKAFLFLKSIAEAFPVCYTGY